MRFIITLSLLLTLTSSYRITLRVSNPHDRFRTNLRFHSRKVIPARNSRLIYAKPLTVEKVDHDPRSSSEGGSLPPPPPPPSLTSRFEAYCTTLKPRSFLARDKSQASLAEGNLTKRLLYTTKFTGLMMLFILYR